jgi:hypothetical protein
MRKREKGIDKPTEASGVEVSSKAGWKCKIRREIEGDSLVVTLRRYEPYAV